MIRFERLSIAGFMPFREPSEVQLADQGLVMIVGENRVSGFADSNGAGKTAIIDALTWVLYDKILRDGVPADRIINSESDSATVSLEFSVDEKPYRIIKHRDRAGAKSWTLRELDPDGAVTGEPVDVSENRIDDIVGLSYVAFSNTLLFGQGPRFADLRDSERKRVFDDLVDTVFLGEKRKVVDAELGLLRGRVDELERERESLAESLRGMEEGQKRALAGAERERALLLERIIELNEVLVGNVRLLSADLLILRDVRRVERENERASEERALIGDILTEWRSVACGREAKQKELLATLNRLRKSDVCPTCLRPGLRAGELEGHYKRLIDAGLKSVQDAWRTYEMFERGRAAITIDVPSDEKHVRERVREQQRLTEECLGKILAFEEMLEKEDTEELALEWYDAEIGRAKARLSEVERDLGQLAPGLAMREFWLEGFGSQGLRSIILATYEEFLNGRLAEHSRILTGGELLIRIRARTPKKSGKGEKENIFFDVSNAHGGGSYEYQSEGEKQRVDLCLVLALQDLVRDLHRARMNIAFYDEIFDHLDDTGSECAMQFLLERRRDVGSIFLISQSPRLLAYPSDRRITVTKNSEGSTIDVS